MNILKPVSISAETSHKFVVRTDCNGKEESFTFSVDPGPTPLIHEDDSFMTKAFEYSETCIWISRAVSYLLSAYESTIELKNGDSIALRPLSIGIGDSTKETTRYLVKFRSQNDSLVEIVFEVSCSDSTYSVTGNSGSWEGKFTNMKLTVSNEDEALPLIKSILSLQRARDVQSID